MTNTSPITVSNFIAGTIGVGIALIVIPGIITGTVGASTEGQNREAIQDFISDVNSVCNDGEETGGTLEIDPNYELLLEQNEYNLTGPDGEVQSSTVSCEIDSEHTFSGNTEYTLTYDSDDDHYQIS